MRNKYGIDPDKHYFMQMDSLFDYTQPFVECRIEEKRHKVADNYMVEFAAVRPGYNNAVIEQRNFQSLLRMGQIIEKENENQHLEFHRWIEPLCGNAYLNCSGYIMTQ